MRKLIALLGLAFLIQLIHFGECQNNPIVYIPPSGVPMPIRRIAGNRAPPREGGSFFQPTFVQPPQNNPNRGGPSPIRKAPPFGPQPRVTARPPSRIGPIQQPPTTRSVPIQQPPNFNINIDKLVTAAISIVEGEDMQMKLRLQNDIDRYGKDFTDPDPLLFSESPEVATRFSKPSRVINFIASMVRKQYPGTPLSSVLSSPVLARYSVSCPFKSPTFCDSFTKYRTVDGTCNNLDNPLWGSAFVPFKRILPSKYETKFFRDDWPRNRAQDGRDLPNARVVSTRFHLPSLQTSDDSSFSMVLTLFGQFLSHDVTDRAPTKGENDAVMKCCNQRLSTPAGFCSNIPVPPTDFFRSFNRDCMEVPRSLEVTDLNCRMGKREQLNQASAFIDGGAVYGATKNKSDSLRRFRDGLLMMSVPQQLPIIPHGNAQATMQGFAFYAAGDNRVNEFIGLIGMETTMLREHNRIAGVLKRLNPSYNDEMLFQETRRIIIAIIQHITYTEYLPIILGRDLIRKYNLQSFVQGRFTGYDRRVDAGLANVFATVAMRFGHSMLRTTYSLLDRNNKNNGYTPIDLKDTFFRPQTFLLHEDPLMRGMATDSSKKCDRVMSSSVINHLYQTEVGTGGDLAAANIQRAREHGLAEYTSWRSHFGLSVPTDFTTSQTGFRDHDFDTANRLRQIYRYPGDVDLFSAGLSEKPVPQGAVGPTFGNIIAQQFKDIKEGDRFWYETSESPQRFTDGQLAEIRKFSMARLLCNAYSFEKIQRNVFLNPDPFTNQLTPCSFIPDIDLNQWRF